jgi:membrane protease YdiL (CAAX protease family)
MLDPPFTVAQFFAVFADYNAAIWPLQIVAYGLGGVAVITLWMRGPLSNQVILLVLAILWALNGIGYHFLFFSEINPIAKAFALFFLLQSILFAAAAWVPNDLRFDIRLNFRSLAGLLFIVYALLIYEVLGYWAGHGLMAGPLFGVAPCPTTILTIGMLILARGKWVVWLSIIPILWSLIGVAAALQFGVPEDLALPVAGAVLMVMVAMDWPRKRGASRGRTMTLAPWLRSHPMLGYFALTFGISWGGILIVFVATGFDLSAPKSAELAHISVLMLLRPSLSGLIVTAIVSGRPGFRAIGARLINWRVGVRWYAVALLTIPTILLAILLFLSAFVDPAFAPRFQWALFAVGLLAGSFEEIGWTGFATPRLLARQSLGVAGLSLGLLWALWHLLADFRYNIDAMGIAWILEFAIVYLTTLTPYRMLMTWVYSKTQSLLLAIPMHASFTGWLLALFPETSLMQNLFWQSAFALALWGMVAVVLRNGALRHNGGRQRPPGEAFRQPAEAMHDV